MTIETVTLDDRFARPQGRVFVTGVQALVRIALDQRRRDAAAGVRTGGYVTGYRGSPLGGFDLALTRAGRFLAEHDVRFQPGVNEDLAATAIWGTQQVGLLSPSDYDGVFGLWYGKLPGVDRSGDPLKHGNYAGSAAKGGVLLLIGEDPGAKSSTITGQADLALVAHGIPVLNPADIQELYEYGLFGIALSRFSGLWVGMRCVADVVEGSASIAVDGTPAALRVPDVAMPEGGLNIRGLDPVLAQEERLVRHRLPAAQAFVRANRLDRVLRDAPRRRFGIVTTGKAAYDVIEALAGLGIDEATRAALGITIYKVAMAWPLEPEGARDFAKGHDELLVVEEKRNLIEDQLARALYGLPAAPRLVGKLDEHGRALVPAHGELAADALAPLIAQRLLAFDPPEAVRVRLSAAAHANRPAPAASRIARTPWFCSGCPHNSSTRVPEGSRALAGIGCHTLAVYMPERRTGGWTQMGGEGASWIGQAPFVNENHVFQNMGDGTYFHSGLLAIRAAIAAGVDVTFKILYNDAIAMTGGQGHDGALTPAIITRQVAAEGVERIAVVTDEPDKYPLGTAWAKGVAVHHRDALERVQRELREVPGVTVLVYDQTCAAEKRRRRKRGTYPDPAKRIYINDLVCEGCGDCGVKSNCVSVKPLETALGRKRTIDQSSCNKDFSCLDGFCPSFVTVEGGRPRRAAPAADAAPLPAMPAPELPAVTAPYNILVAGIGGTGVVTIGALLGMAAHLDGRAVCVLDQTGLAQKNGAVASHVRIAPAGETIGGARLPGAAADLLLGCDMVVATGTEAMRTIAGGRTSAVIDDHVVPIGAFATDPDLDMGRVGMVDLLTHILGADAISWLDARTLATRLFGTDAAANLLLLGLAWQRGLIPLSEAALLRAIELNAVEVAENKRAFAVGRLAAIDRAALDAMAPPAEAADDTMPETLDAIVAHRAAFLTDYQDAAYAQRYSDLVARVRAAEAPLGATAFAEAVARGYSKLLAYKDEYEVARLYVSGAFESRLAAQFEGPYRLRYHLAPPLLAKRDPETGHLQKRAYGPWVRHAFRLLARLKRLRGTRLDPFGYTAERRTERRLIGAYEAVVDELLAGLDSGNHAVAVELAALPERIRGFGHVKDRTIAAAEADQARLFEAFRNGDTAAAATAAE